MAIRSLYLPQEPVILENCSNELCRRLICSANTCICIYEPKEKKIRKKANWKIILNYKQLPSFVL